MRKLNLELYIAGRLLKGKNAGSVAVPIVKIAVVGIALGVCVMLLSVFIITGFKQVITEKLSGFSAHLNITAYETNTSPVGDAILLNDSLVDGLRGMEEVKQAYPYVVKPAILKSGTEIHGVILKGVEASYDGSFFENHLEEGGFPVFAGEHVSDEIMLSASVAGMLKVKAGDRLSAHFVQDPPRVRMFTVKGVYRTGFKEFDDMTVLCDIRHLQRLNGWKANEVSGVGVELKDIAGMLQAEERVDELLPWNEDSNFYRVITLQDVAPQVFDWLNLLNMNVTIILILILTVAGFNMVSGLLILILDKIGLIGLLKTMGYRNLALQKLFLYLAVGLILRGVVVGNLLAFLLGGVQKFFHVVRLDPGTYYMDRVPICFDWGMVAMLNVGVVVVSVLMLIVPAMLISSIRPIKAIRFE